MGIDSDHPIYLFYPQPSRDLGTEGALDADLALRKCLSGPEPIILGPRYYCANRAIVTTGSYGKNSLYGISKYICIFDLKNVLFFLRAQKFAVPIA